MPTVSTVLHIHPTNTALSAITFDTNVDSPSAGYIVNLGSLRPNERDRVRLAYSEGGDFYGGDVASYRGQMVPITFDVIISDTSKSALMTRVHTLEKTLMDEDGGVLEYRPDGLSASVMATYYTYLRSGPPALKQVKGNTWDCGAHNGVYRIVVEVELMTYPLATSDPASPVSVLGATTVANIGTGSNDFVTGAAANVKGTLPALTRIKVTPATGHNIYRLWVAQRTKGLATFEPTYLEGVGVSVAGTYSTETDSSRCGGTYLRFDVKSWGELEPACRFTITNWSDQKGRCALALVCRANTTSVDDYEVWYRCMIGGTVLAEGQRITVHLVNSWCVVLLGEIDIPETEMASIGSTSFLIDVCLKTPDVTKSGITFDIDALKLLYSDEGVVQVDLDYDQYCPSTGFILMDNLTGTEIAQRIVTSGTEVYAIPNAFGHFICLKPGVNNRLDFLWEANGADRHVPADDASVTVDAIFRTVSPFHET
jgi:hypothetical protein